MKKPTKVKIGRKEYKVIYLSALKHVSHGSISEEHRRIAVVTRACFTGRLRTEKEQLGTFWHELTHGILMDMKHPLWNNERFVVAFATRLHRAVDSAGVL